jgi:hypothetical protein
MMNLMCSIHLPHRALGLPPTGRHQPLPRAKALSQSVPFCIQKAEPRGCVPQYPLTLDLRTWIILMICHCPLPSFVGLLNPFVGVDRINRTLLERYRCIKCV